MVATPFTAPRLRQLAHRAARSAGSGGQHAGAAQERCSLCAEPVTEVHRHLLDLKTRAVSCACRACSLLFDRQEAGGAHYRLLPLRRQRLEGCAIDEGLWAGLGIPVDLAFFSRSEVSGEVSVGYPSPLGTLWSTVEPQRWREVEASHPVLSTMAADVEALLVNRADGAREHWLVPLDDCYRLVAVVRAHWKGLGGGPEVRQHVDTFFNELSDYPPSMEEGSWPASS